MGKTRQQRADERAARRKQRQEQQAARQRPQPGGDEMLSAVVRRRDSLYSNFFKKDIQFSGLGMIQLSEIKDQSLRYYRQQWLKTEIETLQTLRDTGVLDEAKYNQQIDDAADEARQLGFEDLPKNMSISYQQDGRSASYTNLEYDMWFIAATTEGQTFAVWASIHQFHPDIDRTKLAAAYTADPAWFMEASGIVAELSKSLIAKK